MKERKVSWGIAGLGGIAQRFAEDLVRYTENGKLSAVASRSPEQAKQFAERFNCQKHYASYLELAVDPDIEVVYVSTINPFHKSLSKLFLENGKHVLVEKPAFVNLRDWDEMTMLARTNGLLLIEAMKTVTFPAYQKLLGFLKQNKIQLHSIEAAFGFCSQFSDNNRLFDKQLSGGATLDVGGYPLWLYCDIVTSLGDTLRQPTAKISRAQYDVGVDESVEFLFDGPIKGRLRGAITENLERTALLRGVDIEIVIADKWWNPQYIEVLWQGKRFVIDEPIAGGGFECEAQHMTDLILQEQKGSSLIRSTVSRKVIAIMENALRANQLGHLVE